MIDVMMTRFGTGRQTGQTRLCSNVFLQVANIVRFTNGFELSGRPTLHLTNNLFYYDHSTQQTVLLAVVVSRKCWSICLFKKGDDQSV